MYLNYYNLTLKPFEISPDPKFLWLGEKHEEALAAVKYGILDNKGFISLTGDVGTGKTTLVNALANSLDDNTIFAQVSDPSLEQLDFLNLTADALKMNKKFSTRGDFLSHLRLFLNNAYVHQKQVVLVFEEAQRFDQERLEEVRLISNIEKPDKKLINIVFVGQNEFNSILIKNKALRQRHAIIHNIEPLQEFETEQYIMHRLKVAGSERKIFSPEAVREIYSFSEGYPRLINIICDSALLTGYAKEKKIIEPEIIRECAADYLLPKHQKEDAIEELRASSKSIPETGTGIQPGRSENSYQKVAKKVRIKPAGRKFVYVIPMFVIILLIIFGYLYFFGENHASYRNLKTFLAKFKGAKERVVALEGELATRDQVLSQFEQKVAELAEELDREKKGQDLLRTELSTKADLVAEVQQKLEAALASQATLANTIEKSKNEIAALQGEMLDLKAQKASSDTQLGQMKSRNEALAVNLEELKGAKERVAELEGQAAMHKQTLIQSEQKVTDLATALDQEKMSRGLLRAALLTKADLVAELEQKLEDNLSDRAELVNSIEKSRKEIAELKIQLKGLKVQQASGESATVSVEVKPKPTSASEGSVEQGESPNPADVIDRALQKKAK